MPGDLEPLPARVLPAGSGEHAEAADLGQGVLLPVEQLAGGDARS